VAVAVVVVAVAYICKQLSCKQQQQSKVKRQLPPCFPHTGKARQLRCITNRDKESRQQYHTKLVAMVKKENPQDMMRV